MPLPHNAFALFLLQKAFAYWGPSILRHCHRELADSPEVLCHSLGDSVEIRSVWHQKELWGGQPLKETLTNEAYLMKLLSIRNSISKKGGRDKRLLVQLAVICGIDSGLWLELELQTAEVQVPWPQVECLLHHGRRVLPQAWGKDNGAAGRREASKST